MTLMNARRRRGGGIEGGVVEGGIVEGRVVEGGVVEARGSSERAREREGTEREWEGFGGGELQMYLFISVPFAATRAHWHRATTRRQPSSQAAQQAGKQTSSSNTL